MSEENNNGNNSNNADDINKKLTAEEQSKKDAKELADTKAENARLKFDNEFGTVSQTYPFAKDAKDDIKKKVDAGYTVEDATIAVLGKQGKLKTADQIQKENHDGDGLGGSAPINNNIDNGGKKEIKDMTQAEKLQALREEEAKGNIGMKGGTIFVKNQ